MGTGKKREVLELVQRSPVAKRETLAELGVARSTVNGTWIINRSGA